MLDEKKIIQIPEKWRHLKLKNDDPRIEQIRERLNKTRN